MGKNVGFLIGLLFFVGATEGREFHCRADRPWKAETLFEWGDLVLQQVFVNKACNLRIVRARRGKTKHFRNFSFSSAGQVYIYSQFDNPNNPKSTFATSGVKSFYLFPRKNALKAVFDAQRQEFHVQIPSGERIFFSNDPLRVDQERTVDLAVTEGPVAYDNAGGVVIQRPQGVLLNVGYLQGGGDRGRRNLTLEDRFGRVCEVPHHRLFNYFDRTYQVRAGRCDVDLPPNCRCVDAGRKHERAVCETERRVAHDRHGRRAIDESRPKPDIESIISNVCPQFTATRLTQAGAVTSHSGAN